MARVGPRHVVISKPWLEHALIYMSLTRVFSLSLWHAVLINAMQWEYVICCSLLLAPSSSGGVGQGISNALSTAERIYLELLIYCFENSCLIFLNLGSCDLKLLSRFTWKDSCERKFWQCVFRFQSTSAYSSGNCCRWFHLDQPPYHKLGLWLLWMRW